MSTLWQSVSPPCDGWCCSFQFLGSMKSFSVIQFKKEEMREWLLLSCFMDIPQNNYNVTIKVWHVVHQQTKLNSVITAICCGIREGKHFSICCHRIIISFWVIALTLLYVGPLHTNPVLIIFYNSMPWNVLFLTYLTWCQSNHLEVEQLTI